MSATEVYVFLSHMAYKEWEYIIRGPKGKDVWAGFYITELNDDEHNSGVLHETIGSN